MYEEGSNKLTRLSMIVLSGFFTLSVALICLLISYNRTAVPEKLNKKLINHIEASVGTESEHNIKQALNGCKIPDSDLITIECYINIMSIEIKESNSESK